MYAGNPVCCLVNPFLGHEAEGIAPAEKAKKVMVIGGGVAGLCAAFIAQEKGHLVTLYEASDKLGGNMRLAAYPPRNAAVSHPTIPPPTTRTFLPAALLPSRRSEP